MASLPVYSRDGNKAGSYEIEPTDLAATINRQLLHDAVVMYQANRRQGSHKTKTRAEVAGSTAKMYRQKGTGNARAGSRRSGIRRGGGHIFPRRNRDYSYRLPRKALRAATRMALASKVADEQLVVLDQWGLGEPKTKEVASTLKALGLSGVTTLIVTEDHDANVYKSGRNIEGVTVMPAADLNALAVLQPSRVLVTKAALDQLKNAAPAAAK